MLFIDAFGARQSVYLLDRREMLCLASGLAGDQQKLAHGISHIGVTSVIIVFI